MTSGAGVDDGPRDTSRQARRILGTFRIGVRNDERGWDDVGCGLFFVRHGEGEEGALGYEIFEVFISSPELG